MTPDKKSDQTKHMLTASLKKIMAQKPLNKISIREICEDCGVNRQTFYYHFNDIYDQLEWMFKQEEASFIKDNDDMLIWQDCLMCMFQYLEENRAVCMCVLNSVGHDYIRKLFVSDAHDIIERYINIISPVQHTKEYMDFLINFYSCAIAGMVECWFHGEIKNTPEELIKNLEKTIKIQLNGEFYSNET